MKFTFGMIVCNGSDFLIECLESVYQFAHAICIAEGATVNWAKVHGWSSPRSNDGTIEKIRSFPDPQNKIKLYQHPTFYSEKNEQCNSYFHLIPADTDYLWQLDSDEFYLPEDLQRIDAVQTKKNYTYIEFPAYHFFKNLHTVGVGGDGWGWDTPIPRLFEYRPGRTFTTHRPPTIYNEDGKDLRQVRPLNARDIGVWMRHYSYVTDKQVTEKMQYYQRTFGRDYMGTWYKNVWTQWDKNRELVESKYSTHPSAAGGKTASYIGGHPEAIRRKFGL